jgi:hypothetical protein
LLLPLLIVAGCRPKSDRLPLSGKVLLNGQPLDSGSIRFGSSGGQKIFSSGTEITNGEYHIPKEKGVPPGTYRVEISSPDTKAPPIVVRLPGQPPSSPIAPERIPAEYNTNSNKTVEVSTSSTSFDFDIKANQRK